MSNQTDLKMRLEEMWQELDAKRGVTAPEDYMLDPALREKTRKFFEAWVKVVWEQDAKREMPTVRLKAVQPKEGS